MSSEDTPRVTANPSIPGRSTVSRRAIADLVRAAVVGSYGVTGFRFDSRTGRLLGALRLCPPAIGITLDGTPDGRLEVDVRVTVAYGLPIAEVARQVDSAIRFVVHRALEREPSRLTIHVGGLRYEPAAEPPPSAPIGSSGADETGFSADAAEPDTPGPAADEGSRGAG